VGRQSFTALAVVVALCVGCGRSDNRADKKKPEPTLEEEAREAARDVRNRAEGGLDVVRSEARDKMHAAREQVGRLGDRASALKDRAAAVHERASALEQKLENTGLDAIEFLRPYAEKGKGGIEELIVQGKVNAVAAARVVAATAPAIAEGVGFRPIYIELGGKDDQEAIDRAIGNMPRVEVIDGLTVGFRAFTKRQFLVVWRRDDRLIGFVYTSLIDVLIGHVVEQAPRLIALAEKVT